MQQRANRVFQSVSRHVFAGTILRWSLQEQRAFLRDMLRWAWRQPRRFGRFVLRVLRGDYRAAVHLFRRRVFAD
jgi:hypothetical protein